AQAAAMVTDCDLGPRLLTAVRTGLPNSVMTKLVMRNLRMIGPLGHTEEDKEFARAIQENLGLKPMEEPYDESIIEPEHAYNGFRPADDVNEFTWYAPTARLYVSKSLVSVPNFQYPRWVSSALCGMGATHRMGETAAKVLAASAVELLTDPELLEAARAEYEERLSLHSEEPLVPKGLKPPTELRWPEWISRPGEEWWILS
ncbi:MAG: amidohydrolase, partial [Candidatus Bathyarchaeia archaeon]